MCKATSATNQSLVALKLYACSTSATMCHAGTSTNAGSVGSLRQPPACVHAHLVEGRARDERCLVVGSYDLIVEIVPCHFRNKRVGARAAIASKTPRARASLAAGDQEGQRPATRHAQNTYSWHALVAVHPKRHTQ
eukprot:6970923-Prymnesium_polylepis.1